MFDYQLELILVIQQIINVTAVIVGSPKSITLFVSYAAVVDLVSFAPERGPAQ